MVEFSDGAVKAQLGVPDMRLPIEYALSYPRRGELMTQALDFWELPALHFEKPDTESFPGLNASLACTGIGSSSDYSPGSRID